MKEKELPNNSGALFLFFNAPENNEIYTLSPLGFGYLCTLKFETKNHELPQRTLLRYHFFIDIRACTPICHTCFTSRYPPQLSSILSIPIFLNLARHYTLYTKNELQNLRETSPHHFRVGIFICGHFPSFDKIVSVHT